MRRTSSLPTFETGIKSQNMCIELDHERRLHGSWVTCACVEGRAAAKYMRYYKEPFTAKTL